LAYVLPQTLMFRERYHANIKKSNIHDKSFLDSWYGQHIYGMYPKRQIQPEQLPKALLEFLGYNKDMFYFANRGVEIKHFLMVDQWNTYFKPLDVLDLGCGKGPYLLAWNIITGLPMNCGVELSQWAVDNALTKNVVQGDITDEKVYGKEGSWDLINLLYLKLMS